MSSLSPSSSSFPEHRNSHDVYTVIVGVGADELDEGDLAVEIEGYDHPVVSTRDLARSALSTLAFGAA